MAVDAGKVAFNPRGAYSSTTTYERLDVVTYQSNTYVALQTTLGNLPTDTSSWMALVKVDNASMSVRGLVKVDGTSITADADGTIHGHAAAGVNSFNGRDGDVLPEYGDYDAEQIAYDNTDSGLESNRAQGAIDELTPKKIITANDAFDPTKTYAVRDWFIHQGVLYEVITECTGVTPPNATYYAPRTIEEFVSIIRGSILTPYKGTNVISGDFNNYTQSGIYGCNNTSGIANAPVSGADNGYLIVFALTSLYIMQIWVGTYQGDITIRYFHTNTWSAWTNTTFKPLQGSSISYNVDITSYNSNANSYEVPCDGYIVCLGNSSSSATAYTYNGTMAVTANSYMTVNSIFVRKGALIHCTVTGTGKVYFRA